jgi:1,4-dihydroxy-2-naphthoyl-CoA hydrolase
MSRAGDPPWDDGRLPSPVVPFDRTFENYLRLEWIELTSTSAHVRFEAREELKQPLGLLHGGIYSAVAETVASVATVHEVWNDGLIGSGQSNSANFLRPITGGWVDVTARLRHGSDHEWLWSHDFRDEQGRLCALVDVVIAVRPVPG